MRLPGRGAPTAPRAPVASPGPAPRRALAVRSAVARPPTPPPGGATPYLPRRPQASPLCRLLADHFEALTRVYEDRYEPTHGALRSVVAEVEGKFLDCGLLEHGFARVRCAACRAEFLVAFRCKGRGFCPSCQSRRLAEWSLWLDEQLLAPVAHRHVVLTIPKRLRAYFLYDRRRLGLLSRVAYHTLHGYVGAALGESDAVPGVVSLAQSFGSLAYWHPHLHLVVTDGAFRRDGRFVTQTTHDAAMLVEVWRRTVLALFVRESWLEQDAAASMLAWPHSGFSAYVGPAIAAEDRAAVLRVARYGARAPVAESRLRYDAERAEVELASDAVDGPYVMRLAPMNFFTLAAAGAPSSIDTPTTANPRAAYLACSDCSSGMDFTHGGHHVAQKSSSTTWPLRLAFDTAPPRRSRSENPGAGRGSVGGANDAGSASNSLAPRIQAAPPGRRPFARSAASGGRAGGGSRTAWEFGHGGVGLGGVC